MSVAAVLWYPAGRRSRARRRRYPDQAECAWSRPSHPAAARTYWRGQSRRRCPKRSDSPSWSTTGRAPAARSGRLCGARRARWLYDHHGRQHLRRDFRGYDPPPYDPIHGIQPIILIGTTGLVMTVHPSIPARSVKELVDYARAHPGRLNYASVGTGSVPHLAQELFRLQAGIRIVHVPYKGAGPALIALVGGEVQLTTISLVAILPHVKAGRLRALAITTPARSNAMPDLPPLPRPCPGSKSCTGTASGAEGHAAGGHRYAVEPRGGESAPHGRDESRAAPKAWKPPAAPRGVRALIRRDVEKWRRVMKEAKIQDAQ